MEITLDPEYEALLIEAARLRRTSPEALAAEMLRAYFLDRTLPRNEWERNLRKLGSDCGVSLSNEALSSEGIYD